MSNQKIQIKAGLHLAKPVRETFEAIAVRRTRKGFLSQKAMDARKKFKTVNQTFREMDIAFWMRVKTESPRSIVFAWVTPNG